MTQAIPAAASSAGPAMSGMRIKHPFVVRLYTRLYAARFGFVSHPQPRGAFRPSE